MNPIEHLEHPDQVGESEYRAIYQCLSDGLEDIASMDKKDLALAMLGEFESWAKTLKKRINKL